MSTGVQELLKDTQMMWGDFVVIAVYFAAVIGVGIWVNKCQNTN